MPDMIKYALQRVSDKRWICVDSEFYLAHSPDIFDSYEEALVSMVDYCLYSHRLGRVCIKRINMNGEEEAKTFEAFDTINQEITDYLFTFIKKIHKALRKAKFNRYDIEYLNCGTIKNLFCLHAENNSYQYFAWAETVKKSEPKIATYKNIGDAYLIKSTSDLVALKLQDAFQPYFIYDITNDKVIL